MKIKVTIVLLALAVSASRAEAEPNPFDDYETKKAEAPAEVIEAPPRIEVEIVGTPKLRTKKGQWSVGLDTAFSWTTGRNDVSGGGRATNTNLFVRVTPAVGWFVLDDLQIGGVVGFLSQSTARQGGGTATESDWMLAATGRYFVRLSERFAVVPALSLGGYVGSANQPVESASGQTVDESASTAGFIGSLEIAGAYQLTQELALRAGLAFTTVFGSQSIEATNESLAVRTMNTGLSLGMAYAW